MQAVGVAVKARRQQHVPCCSSSTRGIIKLDHVHKYGGLCTVCPGAHVLCSTPEAIEAVQELLASVDHHGRLDFDCPIPDPRFSTDWLWTRGPGRMLGVLTAVDQQGQSQVLKAFSGQITESWHIPGWVGPVANFTNTSQQYMQTRFVVQQLSAKLQELQLLSSTNRQQLIHAVPSPKSHRPETAAAATRQGTSARRRQRSAAPTHQKQSANATSAERFIAQQQQLLKSRRKSISHHLLHCIQQSYQTCSISGERLSLLDVYLSYLEQHDPGLPVTRTRGFTGMPAGVGDCCAPKLLHAAAAAKLVPTGLVEVWYGSPPGTATPAKQGRAAAAAGPGNSGSRRHYDVYGMCDKCKAILGTMLCGLQGQVDM